MSDPNESGGLPPLGDLPPMGGSPDLGSMPGGAMDMPATGGLPDLGAATLPPPDMGQGEPASETPDLGGGATDAPVLERRDETSGAKFKRSIYALPVTVDIVVGSSRPTVTELLALDEGSLLSLDRKIEDPVDLCVDGRVIARGELVEMDEGGIGVRITQVVDVAEDALG
ncbi:MAG: FliM/FliN family flagellar motor switch protein [Litorimonas sp.]